MSRVPLSDLLLEELNISAAGMALAHVMRPNYDDRVKMDSINLIRGCFLRLGDAPKTRRRVIDVAERYTRRVEDGIETASERHGIENVLGKLLDYKPLRRRRPTFIFCLNDHARHRPRQSPERAHPGAVVGAGAIREKMLKSVPDGCNLIESGCLGSINMQPGDARYRVGHFKERLPLVRVFGNTGKSNAPLRQLMEFLLCRHD